jgi:endonuclease/exonuclease/phosphatase (EEP) superfamily protein YafD
MLWLRTSRFAAAIVWAFAGICAAWALIRTFGLEGGYPIVPLISWTPFVIPVAALAAVLAALASRWAAVAAAGLATLLLIVAVAPRAFGGGHEPAEPVDGPNLHVLSTNLKLGRADPEAVVTLVRDNVIDVLCAQELTAGLAADLEAAGLGDLLPHSVTHTGPESSGSAIFSRHPLTPRPGVEPPGYGFVMPRAAVAVPGAGELEVASVHTVPPTGSNAVEDWEEGLDALPETGETDTLTLLVGDFNATLDHAAFRDVVDRGYVDAGDATGEGLRFTWPERLQRPGVTIDHVLADERIAITGYDVHELPNSDHRAVSAVLRLPGG